MAELGFRIVDADNHYYEPDDCFTRHMEQAYAHKAVNIRRGATATAWSTSVTIG